MVFMAPRTLARWRAYSPATSVPVTPNPTAAELVPDQVVEIYGGVPVTVLEVRPVASELDQPWVALRYQWATDAHGRPMEGVWVLPATQRLPLS